jgi:hypothetical protein
MAWPTARADLRKLLSDGDTDKLRYRKKLVGRVDGTNKTFKSLEKRRLTNLKTDAGPTRGVFIEGTRVDQVTGITSDDTEVGEVILVTAPTQNKLIEATYYLQWFLDAELDTFLVQASQWLGFTNPDGIQPGLQPAAMYYAAQESYHKLAVRWAETLSDEFRLEDAPSDKTQTPMDMYRRLAEDARKKSEKLRDDFYSGQGTQNQATSVSLVGAVRRVVPNR